MEKQDNMSNKQKGTDYFGYYLPFQRLKNNSTLKVRRKIYDWFKSQIGGLEGKVILDHGSTPDTTRQASNCFIRWLIKDGAKVYATSPENISHLEQVFPGLTVIPWSKIQSDCDKFDYIISSAVIEHVGLERCQIEYLSNLLELCPRILVTTPNRHHWLEFHTRIPLLHWLPRSWHRTVLHFLGLKFWANEKNLRLLSKKELARMIDSTGINHIKPCLRWYEPKFLGAISNLIVLIEQKQAK